MKCTKLLDKQTYNFFLNAKLAHLIFMI